MKPIYIKMSAFGSYGGETVIDFSDIHNGIFLITGDTGAGKTTIFDAITYALYDETSGGKRNGEMMRSQYADDDTATYVEYSFAYRGETYTIIRSPRQSRVSKRRNKDGDYTMTTEQPAVTLILPDGRQYAGKIKETNQKIIDIIGLDVNQFTQTAMIAQGDFLKLLHASSRERKEIFTKIFNTSIYWRIEEELRNRAKAMHGELEDNRKAIIRETGDIECVRDSELESQWTEMPDFMESEQDKQLGLIKRIIDEAKAKEKEITEALAMKGQELEELITRIKQAEDINKLFSLLEAALQKKEELDSRKDEMASVKARIEAGKKALIILPKEKAYLSKQEELSECHERIKEMNSRLEDNKEKLERLKQEKEEKEEEYKKNNPVFVSRISSMNELLPKYEELDTNNNEKSTLEKSRSAAQTEYDELIENTNKTREAKGALQKQQEQLKIISDQYVPLKYSVEKRTERKDALEALLNAVRLMKTRKVDYERENKEYKEIEREYELKRDTYDELYHGFIEGQAGVLAAALEEGCSCPVCGSVTHPDKAVSTEWIIDESQLRDAKAKMEEALHTKQKKYEELQKAVKSYEIERERADNEGKKIMTASFNPDTIADTDIQSMLEECEKQLKDETDRRNQAEEAGGIYISNQARIKSLEEILERYEYEKEETDKALNELAVSLAKTDTLIAALKKDLIYESKIRALEELLAFKAKQQELETAKEKAVEEYQSVVNKEAEIKGSLEAEEKSLFRLTEEMKVLEAALNHEIEIQGFCGREDYHHALIGSERLEELSLALQSYREEIVENETNVKNFSEQTKDKSRIQTTELEERRTELTEIKEELEREGKAVYGIRTRDEEIFKKVTRLIREREKIKKTFGNINRLANTANGKLSGRHMNFQTYIQRRYFSMILHEANKRLYTMSNNQFILKCRDMEELSGQGEVGLDLDIYSMVNDQVRDVKTLSGGESFMAALAMALGMSDIIQNTAGRIHIDTMFIDEGFGSLSDDTRMQAIRILNDLSGGKRLVGIISHVTELKAQIGTKLIVTKGEKGSRARWEIS